CENTHKNQKYPQNEILSDKIRKTIKEYKIDREKNFKKKQKQTQTNYQNQRINQQKYTIFKINPRINIQRYNKINFKRISLNKVNNY
ncbi:hypothetical protein ACJBXF_10240, partial [Streptococcus suis]